MKADNEDQNVGVNIARALRVATYAIPAGVVQDLVASLKKAAPKKQTGRVMRF